MQFKTQRNGKLAVEKKDQAKQSKENQGKSKYSGEILKEHFVYSLLEIIKTVPRNLRHKQTQKQSHSLQQLLFN